VRADLVRSAGEVRDARAMHPIKKLSAQDRKQVDRLRKICMGFPDASERLSHGEPCWFAGKGKSFAMLDNHHHGAEHLAVWLPVPPGAQQTLVDIDPGTFFVPPYVGGKGWVGVVLDQKPDWDQVADLVRQAFLNVAGKRLQQRLLAGDG
jgi:hypothetical protein